MSLGADDVRAITQVEAELAHTIDFGPAPAYAALYRPDGVFERHASAHGGGAILVRHAGREHLEAFAAAVADRHDSLARHWNANLSVTEDAEAGPGHAIARSYTMLVSADLDTGAVSILGTAVYVDRLVHIDGNWLVATRTITDDR
jgi:hypothetical protein